MEKRKNSLILETNVVDRYRFSKLNIAVLQDFSAIENGRVLLSYFFTLATYQRQTLFRDPQSTI